MAILLLRIVFIGFFGFFAVLGLLLRSFSAAVPQLFRSFSASGYSSGANH